MSSALSQAWQRIMLMLARGIVKAVNADGKLQTITGTLLYDETRGGLEHFETYGLTANPPAGLEFLAAFVGGDRSHGIVIAVGDRKFRLQGLEPGEVALYTDEGDKIHFQRGRKIAIASGNEIDASAANKIVATAPEVVIAASTKLRCETPLLECTGEIKDLCDGAGETMSEMRSTYNAHDHNLPGGGTTTVPNQPM